MLCAWYLFSASVGLERPDYGKNAAELVIGFSFLMRRSVIGVALVVSSMKLRLPDRGRGWVYPGILEYDSSCPLYRAGEELSTQTDRVAPGTPR